MKLFIVATLIAVSSAARLEHLEQQQRQLRAYLPPNHNSNYASQGSFGAISGAYGTAGADQPGFNARASFPSASNQYLPPDHGPSASASTGGSDFAGSIYGFRAQNGQQDSSPQGTNNNQAQARYQQQSHGSNSQYGQPEIPQQAFDEKTGYHY